MTDLVASTRRPRQSEYAEPGQFIRAWRKFTLGQPVPEPTAGPTSGSRVVDQIVDQYNWWCDHVTDDPEAVARELGGEPRVLRGLDLTAGFPVYNYVANRIKHRIEADIQQQVLLPIKERVLSRMHQLCRRKVRLGRLYVPILVSNNGNGSAVGALGPDQRYCMCCDLMLEVVPPRCQNTRRRTLVRRYGANGRALEFMAEWVKRFPGDETTALAWRAVSTFLGWDFFDYDVRGSWYEAYGTAEARKIGPDVPTVAEIEFQMNNG